MDSPPVGRGLTLLSSLSRQGAALIARLVHLSAGRLSVMPGGGVSAQNVAQLVRLTGAGEVHASARGRRRSLMAVPAGVSMGAASDERCWLQCDPDQVRAIRLGETLSALFAARGGRHTEASRAATMNWTIWIGYGRQFTNVPYCGAEASLTEQCWCRWPQ